MGNGDRHSEAQEVELITDPIQLAEAESYNVIKQYRLIEDMVSSFLDPERPFKLRPSHLLTLHRAALQGISPLAGVWRPGAVKISGSGHARPDAWEVPERVEELCDYVNDMWTEKSPLHLASYVMWRLNWIHPFTDGNGRTSRAVSYLVLCIRLRMLLPGRTAIPQQIEQEKTPYYKALEAADDAYAAGKIDLTAMKNVLGPMLAKQLHAVYTDSETGGE